MISQRQIAKELGMTASRVTQLKQKGMPVDSTEAARAWMLDHPTPQQGRKLAGVDASAVISEPPPEVEVTANDEDPEVVLQRLRKSECDAYKLLAAEHKKAMESGNGSRVPALIRLHSQAAQARLEAERKWEKHRVKMGDLVTTEFARGLIQKVLAPLEAQLAQLPKLVAAAANPGAPLIAERAIEKGLAALYEQVGAALKIQNSSL